MKVGNLVKKFWHIAPTTDLENDVGVMVTTNTKRKKKING